MSDEVARQFQQFRTFMLGTLQGYVDKRFTRLITSLADTRTQILNRFIASDRATNSIIDSLSELHAQVDDMQVDLAALDADIHTQLGEIKDELKRLGTDTSTRTDVSSTS